MCGLAGFFDVPEASHDVSADRAVAMVRTLAHRGPDDEGTWIDPANGIALGVRRLAVVGLSPAGHQPMISPSGRYVVAYNGEITNFRRLAAEVEDPRQPLQTGTDTEVLLHAFDRWGLLEAVQRCTGMFAFAVWDRSDRRLTLGRDRMGERPLYYGLHGRTLLFGSELKSLRAHPSFRDDIDQASLTEYLRWGYVPAPASIHTHVRKLPPGHMITFDRPDDDAVSQPYWSLAEVVQRSGARRDVPRQLREELDKLDELLQVVVADCMVADVPVGAFLSGGTDSALVVALMQAQSTRPVRTFTLGFEDAAYDETARAAEIARLLGTEHTELRVTPAEAMAVVPELATIYDEPFADSSQVPTVLVSRLARQDVTVALSGDGGDELFGGYERYRLAQVFERAVRVPAPVRRLTAKALAAVPDGVWERTVGARGPLPNLRLSRPAEKAQKLVTALAEPDLSAAYARGQSLWPDPSHILLEPVDARPAVQAAPPAGLIPIEQLMYLDTMTYLPDDILVKVDRAALSASLETRIPLLDHRIVEHAWSLPAAVRVGPRPQKQLLREVVRRRLPQLEPSPVKMGFGVPVGQWMRGPLRGWVEELLAPRRLAESGLIPGPVTRVWDAHRTGVIDASQQLWAIVMLQAWFEEWRCPSTARWATPDVERRP